MRLNEYRSVMDGLKVPESKKHSVLIQLGQTEIKYENTVSKARIRGFRWIPAVAAVLVLSIVATVILTVVEKPDNVVVLKAGAAEITSEDYVHVGELLSDGSMLAFSFDSGKEDDITDTATSLLNYKEMTACVAFSLDDITCTGEDIDTVEYRIHGSDCYLGYGNALGSTLLLKDNRFVSAYGEVANGDTLISDKTGYHMYLRYNDESGRFRDESYLRKVIYEDENGKEIEEMCVDEMRIFSELFNADSDEIYMEITVTFTNGSTITKLLTFEVIKADDGAQKNYILTAKITE